MQSNLLSPIPTSFLYQKKTQSLRFQHGLYSCSPLKYTHIDMCGQMSCGVNFEKDWQGNPMLALAYHCLIQGKCLTVTATANPCDMVKPVVVSACVPYVRPCSSLKCIDDSQNEQPQRDECEKSERSCDARSQRGIESRGRF